VRLQSLTEEIIMIILSKKKNHWSYQKA